MKNHYAILLTIAAERYRISNNEAGCNRAVTRSDYNDLMRVAKMIERNKSARDVARAMWNLDTCVRDAIPDEVYESTLRAVDALNKSA